MLLALPFLILNGRGENRSPSLELALRNKVIGVESAVIDFFIESLDLLDGHYKVFYSVTLIRSNCNVCF